MALRDRALSRPEVGPPYPPVRASLVVARYGLMDVFTSRIFLAFYVLCLMPSISALIAIYLSHSSALVEQIPGMQEWAAKVPEWIFPRLFGWQAMPALLVAVIAAPPLIAADLSHNALTLILARPVARTEYILGKVLILVVLLSPLTWIPALLCCTLEAMLDKAPWVAVDLRVPVAYLVGHWLWLLVISLYGLAVSSRVRYAALARGVMLASVLIASGTGVILNQLTRTSAGDLLRLPRAIEAIFMTLNGAPSPSALPVVFNWMSLLALAILSLWILNRRLRACEEVA